MRTQRPTASLALLATQVEPEGHALSDACTRHASPTRGAGTSSTLSSKGATGGIEEPRATEPTAMNTIVPAGIASVVSVVDGPARSKAASELHPR